MRTSSKRQTGGMQNSVTKILEGRTSRIVHCESEWKGRGEQRGLTDNKGREDSHWHRLVLG